MSVAFAEDDWTRERWLFDTRWNVLLSSGVRAFSDDGRPGQERSSWLRLKDYVTRTGLRIESLWLSFRDQVVRPVREGATGYFLRRSALLSPGATVTHAFFVIGYLLDDKVYVQTWKVPELLCEGSEVRDRDDGRLVGDSLIVNPRSE